MFLVYIIGVGIIWPGIGAAGSWSYLEFGHDSPGNWSGTYPSCGKHSQSPINLIKPSHIKKGTNLEEILFVDYDEYPDNQTWQLTNNGHTVQLQARFSHPPQLQRGSLNAKYDFLQVHFHWGIDDFKGSEHRVNGRSFPLEMHIVHKRHDHGEAEDAEKSKKHLAVVGIFFNVTAQSNANLKTITDNLKLVEQPDTVASISLPFFTLLSILPAKRDFFRYYGSLTTPPCDATVQWSVLLESVPISRDQLQAFRSLRAHKHASSEENAVDTNSTRRMDDKPGSFIVNNFRPVQPLGDRSVSFFTSTGGAVFDRKKSIFATVCCLLVIFKKLFFEW